MKQFHLPAGTNVKLRSVNVRSEMHGKNHVPAVDVRLELTASNQILEQLKPGLRQALYLAADAGEAPPQGELDGVEAVSDLPLLRVQGLETVKLSDDLSGYTTTLDIGMGRKESLVELNSCKVNAFTVDALQGGSVRVSFRVQASGLKEREIGKLGVLIDSEVAIQLEPPLVTDPIDGTTPPASEAPWTAEDVKADVELRRAGGKPRASVKAKMKLAADRAAKKAPKKKTAVH